MAMLASFVPLTRLFLSFARSKKTERSSSVFDILSRPKEVDLPVQKMGCRSLRCQTQWWISNFAMATLHKLFLKSNIVGILLSKRGNNISKKGLIQLYFKVCVWSFYVQTCQPFFGNIVFFFQTTISPVESEDCGNQRAAIQHRWPWILFFPQKLLQLYPGSSWLGAISGDKLWFHH